MTDEAKTQVSQRHRKEWRDFREFLLEPLLAESRGNLDKNIKQLAETLKICQEAERKAYDFQDTGAADGELVIRWEDQE